MPCHPAMRRMLLKRGRCRASCPGARGFVPWAACCVAMLCCGVFATPTRAGTTWDAGGGNTNFTNGANWNDDSAPTFTGGTSTLTFATAGSTATVDTAANLARIIFDRDVAFSIADGSGSLALAGETVGGVLTGITASPATAGTTVAYTISESIALGATQSWNVANNGAGGTSLSVSGVISGAGVGLTKIGSGTLALSGANTFTGVMSINGGTVEVGSWNLSGADGVWGNRTNNGAAVGTTFIQMNGGRINYTGVSASGTLRGINLASGTNTIAVGSGATLNFASTNTFQSNGGNLVKEGAGTLKLGSPFVANGVFTGKVTINSGTLEWWGGGSMPAPASLVSDFITINDGATFAMSFAGGSTVNANIGFRLSGNATILSGGGSNAIAGPIADGASTGSLAKTGAGTLNLSATNTYSGNTTISAGRLTLGGNGVLGSGSYAGTIANAGELVLGSAAAQILSGVISGTGSLTKSGTGTLTLSAANTFSGPLIVAEGVLSINEWNVANANGPLGNSAANVVLGSATSAGTLRYTGVNSFAPTTLRGIDLAAGGGVIQLTGTARDDGYVHIAGSRISGSGQLTINSPGMTRFLLTGGSSGFSGPVRVQAGELQGNVTFSSGTYTPFGTGSNGLGSAMTIDSGAILRLQGGSNYVGVRLGSLAGSGTVTHEGGTYNLLVGGDDTSTTFSGVIGSGPNISLTKVGSGTLTLNGINSYTGATQISVGALLVGGTLGATAVTVQSGGLLGGSGLIGGSVSVLAGGTFSPGNSPGLLTSGPLSLAGTTLMEIDGLAPRGGVGGYDAANINGLLTYGGSMLIDFGAGVTSAFADNTTFNLFSFTSQSNSFSGISTVSDGSFYAGLTFTNSGNNDKWTATKGSQTLEFTHSTGSLVIVPEPAAIALALSGIALGAGLRWRRRRAA